MKKMVYKLVDRSLVLATEIESTSTTVTVKAPISVTQMMNTHTGQPEVTMIPMDLIFAEAAVGKDTVTFKQAHIMYAKDMADFPAYEQNYTAQTTSIETIQKSGILV